MKYKVLILSIVFCFLISPVGAFAMEWIWTPESINGLADFGYSLAGGAQYDLDNSKYKIDGYENMSEAEKLLARKDKAAELIRDYCILRGLPLPDDWYNPDLTNPGQYYSTFFNRESQLIYQDVTRAQNQLEIDEALRFTLNAQTFADWSQYSQFWYKKYINSNTAEEETPEVVIPSEFTSYVNLFVAQNDRIALFPSVNGGIYIDGNFSDYTLVSNVNLIDPYENGAMYFYTANKADIFITGSSSSGYSFSYNPTYVYPAHSSANPAWSHEVYAPNATFFVPAQHVDFVNFLTNTGETKPTSFTASGTLDYILTYIQYRFFNFNLYVNGELWIGEATDIPGVEPLIPDFPDIFNPDSDNPAYDIVLPGSSDYEGTFDLTSVLNKILEAIEGAQDNSLSTSAVIDNTAIKDGVRDKTGELVADASLPIARVLTDSFPIQGSLNYPDIPIYGEPIHNAFSGTTILAQLIDATQKTVPESLIVVFWGIVFILFIIGLIKVFHK